MPPTNPRAGAADAVVAQVIEVDDRGASVAELHGGVVTVVQRFRSDLGLYVHLHLLVTGALPKFPDETS